MNKEMKQSTDEIYGPTPEDIKVISKKASDNPSLLGKSFIRGLDKLSPRVQNGVLALCGAFALLTIESVAFAQEQVLNGEVIAAQFDGIKELAVIEKPTTEVTPEATPNGLNSEAVTANPTNPSEYFLTPDATSQMERILQSGDYVGFPEGEYPSGLTIDVLQFDPDSPAGVATRQYQLDAQGNNIHAEKFYGPDAKETLAAGMVVGEGPFGKGYGIETIEVGGVDKPMGYINFVTVIDGGYVIEKIYIAELDGRTIGFNTRHPEMNITLNEAGFEEFFQDKIGTTFHETQLSILSNVDPNSAVLDSDPRSQVWADLSQEQMVGLGIRIAYQ